MTEQNDITWNAALCGACEGGHKDLQLVGYVNMQLVRDIHTTLFNACYYGDLDLALLTIKKGADLNLALNGACLGGYMDIALLMINKGANNWTSALHYSCLGKHKKLVLLMLKNGADINKCTLNLDEYDVDYLIGKIKDFGKFKHIAKLCMNRRNLANQIVKELNLRDIDTVIYTY